MKGVEGMELYERHAMAMMRAHVNELAQLWEMDDVWAYKRFCRHNGLQYDSGMTRNVLIGTDYVIKIDKRMCGNWRRFGMCYDEYNNYRQVYRDGFSYLFAKVKRFKIAGHWYYVMPRVELGNIDEKDLSCEESIDAEEFDYLNDHFVDLHEANYGYNEGGGVQIIDYAASVRIYNERSE